MYLILKLSNVIKFTFKTKRQIDYKKKIIGTTLQKYWASFRSTVYRPHFLLFLYIFKTNVIFIKIIISISDLNQ